MSKQVAKQGEPPAPKYWRLTAKATTEINSPFRNQATTVRRLGTNVRIWKAASDHDGEGVLESTVIDLIKRFFDVLYDQARAGFPKDDDFYGYLLVEAHEKYFGGEKHDYRDFIEPVIRPPADDKPPRKKP